ncbi:hypothetical protein SRRS_08040 [Sporomusa rhizae]
MMVLALMSVSIIPSAMFFLDMGDVFVIIAGLRSVAGIGVAVFVKRT